MVADALLSLNRDMLFECMVGKQGFEPWTSTASGWRSPPELLAYMHFFSGSVISNKNLSCQAKTFYLLAYFY